MEYFLLHILYISSLDFISIRIIFGKWQIAYCIHSMPGLSLLHSLFSSDILHALCNRLSINTSNNEMGLKYINVLQMKKCIMNIEMHPALFCITVN